MIPPPPWVNAQENVEPFSADVNWQFQWIVLKFSLSFSHFFLSFILFFLSFIHSAFIVTYRAKEWPFHWASNRQAGEKQHNKRQRPKTVRRLFLCTTPPPLPLPPYPIMQLFPMININEMATESGLPDSVVGTRPYVSSVLLNRTSLGNICQKHWLIFYYTAACMLIL